MSSSDASTASSPWRSRLHGSRAACCLLVTTVAVTAPLAAEAWVAPISSHAAARSSARVAASGWSSRSGDTHNRCEIQQRRHQGGGVAGVDGHQPSGRRRREMSCRSQATETSSAAGGCGDISEIDVAA